MCEFWVIVMSIWSNFDMVEEFFGSLMDLFDELEVEDVEVKWFLIWGWFVIVIYEE